ncbi:unnamed protein product [Nezara viridula]|uniref:Uncharacterized protein n=1 Tax=Nezara viridula TaxID=85310 RepID=A0A9P0H959_NEZVI|nr:unnamed protein product [Nezara viridula]
MADRGLPQISSRRRSKEKMAAAGPNQRNLHDTLLYHARYTLQGTLVPFQLNPSPPDIKEEEEDPIYKELS